MCIAIGDFPDDKLTIVAGDAFEVLFGVVLVAYGKAGGVFLAGRFSEFVVRKGGGIGLAVDDFGDTFYV